MEPGAALSFAWGIMQNRPFVSVAMPVYNGADYFESALLSAINQTYDNYEIVIVNDGSTDDGATAAIGRRYAASHPHLVRYFEKENGGVGSALNFALRKMEGDIFCWLSHDDLYDEKKISEQVRHWSLMGDPNAIVFCDYKLINPDGSLIADVRFTHENFVQAPGLPLYRGCVNGNCVFVPLHLMKKHFFDESKKYTQDYDLWHKLAIETVFYHLPKSLTSYRLHPSQDSAKPAAETEGDELWLRMIGDLSDLEKAQFYGSRWRFYNETYKVLSATKYHRSCEHLLKMRDSCIEDTLVSVVIPFYNEVPLVMRAAQSVLSQTHSKIELILINDGSSESVGPLQALAEEDPRVRLYTQPNAGAGHARNNGLDKANGEYLAFLDADDIFLPEKIHRQLKAMMLRGAAISHTSYYVTYYGKREGYGILRSGAFTDKVFPKIIQGCPMATPTIMLHRSIVGEGFAFPTNTALGEDILMWTSIVQGYLLLGIDDPLTVVEWSDGSAAVNIKKGSRGIDHMVETFRSHPAFSRYSKEIDVLAVAGSLFRDRKAKGETIDYGLIEYAFGAVGQEIKEPVASSDLSYFEGVPMHFNGRLPL
ncbi:glycosyltransferase family 2 protein [Methylorubrum extorquens]